MTDRPPFYVTTPIYYVNDLPHLGHAYTTIAADALARYRRMMGDDVFFLTGTDEHGQKVERAAQKAGLEPKEFLDRLVVRWQELWERLEISHDDFIRTTEPRHEQGALKVFERMREAGDIYEGHYEGLYCTGCEGFYTEGQLEEGQCPVGHGKVELLQEPSLFFRLSKYQEPLLKLYREHPEFVRPETRLREVASFVEMGLKDLSVSRTSFGWGVPIPGAEGHILYVWVDALSNYITALGYGDEEKEKGDYAKYWPAQYHLIGKDILRFHAVYWPAFLMSAGLPLPQTVFSHGWLLMDEKKMSKSAGNVLDPYAYLDVFGPDPIRYYALREVAFGVDGNTSDEGFIERVNADLANDLGNLVSRVTKMIEDYYDGVIPSPPEGGGEEGLGQGFREALDRYHDCMGRLEFHRALEAVWGLVSRINKHIVAHEPWKEFQEKGRTDALARCLYEAAEAIRAVTLLITPVMPGSARRIYAMLGLPDDPTGERLDEAAWGELPPGGKLGTREALFPRLKKQETLAAIGKRREASMVEDKPRTKPEPKPTAEELGKEPFPESDDYISIDDFAKVDLRVGAIAEAVRVEGTDKLVRMRVDLGSETRQLVAGIGGKYEPEQLVGKKIIVVANLKPATIRGVRSEGMLLAAVDGDHLSVATLDRDISPGSTIR